MNNHQSVGRMEADRKGTQPLVDNRAYRFTVFIPTFNRSRTLARALESVAAQTYRDFEVVIIDDGSEDDTRQLVQRWQKGADFPLRYYWQENQGKFAAHNNAIACASGYFFVLLDSDDTLLPQTLERFDFHWRSIPDDQKDLFAGVEGLCLDHDGKIYGDRFPSDVIDTTYIEIVKKYKISGEKRNALRTDVLRQYPYPIFDGERFIRDDLIWKRMAGRFKLRCFNEPVQIIDHQTEGLSANVISIRLKNPKGFRYYFLEEINQYSSLTGRYFRFKYHSKFVRYSLHCKIGFRQQYTEVRSKFYWLISVPRGIIGWLEDKIRMQLKSY
ncbi:MAG: glycosyltransferase family 2 protein [Desulfobacterales bacterium]